MEIRVDDLSHPATRELIALHLTQMRASSPACSVHALDASGLNAPNVTVWSAWHDDTLLGIGALKQLSSDQGEIKSMRTSPGHVGMGVGTAILVRLLDEARARGYSRVSLETGTQEVFAPAHRLYQRHGFVDCDPFATYELDPHSRYMTLWLHE